MRILVTLLGLVSIALPCRAAQAQSPSAYLEHFAAGADALEAGHLATARTELDITRALAPRSPVPPYYLACVAARMEEIPHALELLADAANLGLELHGSDTNAAWPHEFDSAGEHFFAPSEDGIDLWEIEPPRRLASLTIPEERCGQPGGAPMAASSPPVETRAR